MSTKPTQPITFSDRVRGATKGILLPIGRVLYGLGVHPDAITVVGTLLVAVAALFIAQGNFLVGLIIFLAGIPLDALDGTVARLRDDVRPFGAFLDSTLDRYADGLLLGAIAYYGVQQNDDTILLLALVSMVGAFLISYTRARAEGLNIECKIGLFSRLERTIVLILLLLTGWVVPFLIVLAIGTQFTALQRIWHVRQQTLQNLD